MPPEVLTVTMPAGVPRPFLDRIAGIRGEIDRRMDEAIVPLADGGIVQHFRGGKRLRAGTVIVVHEALSDGTQEMKEALDLAAAVEFAHGISLMLDDLLDGDAVRRGKPSVQASRGLPVTVLEAVRLLSVPYSLASPYGPACTGLLATAHEEMVRGALAEMRPAGPEVSMTGYDRLIAMKSGGLFELAARFGALAAGCGDEVNSLAGTYGSGLGTVHQFSDDIVDLRVALAGGQEVRGSEAHLFRCVVPDFEARAAAIDRGALASNTEAKLESELGLRVHRAEEAARRLAAAGRRGDRTGMSTMLPTLLSAPSEIAGIMMSAGGERPLPGGSEDRSERIYSPRKLDS